MSFTTLRIALTTVALCAAAAADARPRRVVVLEFDGERALADSGRDAVVDAVGDDYDLVAPKRWVDARAAATRGAPGPDSWRKVSRKLGVDAVIEGWIQNEGRHKMLSLVVSEARTGKQIDTISIKLGTRGVTDANRQAIEKELGELLNWVEGGSDGNPDPLPPFEKKRGGVGTTERERELDGDQVKVKKTTEPEEEETEDEVDEVKPPKKDKVEDEKEDKEKIEVAAIDDPEQRDNALLTEFFPEDSKEHKIVTGPKVKKVPTATPRFRIAGGGYYASRSLAIEAENPEGVTQYLGVGNKGLGVNAAVYPFPLQKQDGILSGVGFSFGISHSAGSTMTFDDGVDSVYDLEINQNTWDAGIHYRSPLGDVFAIDGEVSYGRSNYLVQDAPVEFEVPDTAYTYFGAGGHLDLAVTERATIGFGGKYLYVLGTGDLSSVDWYGPGKSSGFTFDGNFVVPLPANLYVRGQLAYTRLSTSFDGVGTITEEESVTASKDSTVNGGLDIGIQF